MNIAGKGTYPLRIYPLCYDDDSRDADLYDLSIDDSNYYTERVHWDLNKRLTLKLKEGGRCQLPFDGANTNAFQLLYLPGDGSTGLKSPGNLDFTIGASIDYDMDLYTWDWYGNCKF